MGHPSPSHTPNLAWWGEDVRWQKKAKGRRHTLCKCSFQERITLDQNPSFGKSWCLYLCFLSSVCPEMPAIFCQPRSTGLPISLPDHIYPLWLLQEDGTLPAGSKSPTWERGMSHTPEATSQFVITPWGQEGLRLYFNDHGVVALWRSGIQEFPQMAVSAHSSLSCPRTLKWWHRTIKIALFVHFPPKCYNLGLWRAGNPPHAYHSA